ncbi:hypothetical protein TSUD_262950 [Trifolium subterraneum]|nr:hypothetical protein TSUD_262950 [Trifolium subterraneum]
MAEDFLGKTVEDAVITISACFNMLQRRATREAGIACELNVLKSVNAVLDIDDGIGGGVIVDLKAVGTDKNLGGLNFDKTILDYFVRKRKRLTSTEKHSSGKGWKWSLGLCFSQSQSRFKLSSF